LLDGSICLIADGPIGDSPIGDYPIINSAILDPYRRTKRSVTRPCWTGRTENAGFVRISAVMNGSPSKTISKIFEA
jgi:hypothetical protein